MYSHVSLLPNSYSMHLSVLFYLLIRPIIFLLVSYPFFLSYDMSDAISNTTFSTRLAAWKKCGDPNRSAGREYNEKYIIHNGVFWVGDIGDMTKHIEASYDTPHFFLSQTKTIEEQVYSENTLPRTTFKIELKERPSATIQTWEKK